MNESDLPCSSIIEHALNMITHGQYYQCISYCNNLKERCKDGNLESISALAHAFVGEFEVATTLIDTLTHDKPTMRADWLARKAKIYQLADRHEDSLKISELLINQTDLLEYHLLRIQSFVKLVEYQIAYGALITLRPRFDTGTVIPGQMVDYASEFADVCGRMKRSPEAFSVLDRALASDINLHQRRILLSKYGNLKDAIGDYDEAFSYFSKCNELWHSDHKKYNFKEHRVLIDKLLSGWTATEKKTTPHSATEGGQHLFIVGMPRSGSSLLEQILDSHSMIKGVGEAPWIRKEAKKIEYDPVHRFGILPHSQKLTQIAMQKAGYAYIERVKKVNIENKPVSVDKALGNYRLIGFIQHVLPGSKIIWIRRNPMDSILSCYQQNFVGNSEFSSLKDLGPYFFDMCRTMHHWLAIYPENIHVCDYEKLVENPRAEIERILEFAGLPWDDNCMKHHESKRVIKTASLHQANQQIYRNARHRWLNYKDHLKEPMEYLQAHGLLDAEGNPLY